jgi:DNA-binding YbaB/EbfC family protein
MMDGSGDTRNFQELIQTAQRIQAEVARIKDELSSKTAQGESGGGLVRCVVSGAGEVLSVSIDPTFLTFGQLDNLQNQKMLEDLVVGAINVALERAREIAKQEMARVTGGLPMPPGMFGT